MAHNSVLVTHVESPVLFYCRLMTDEEQFARLQAKIDAHVEEKNPTVPNVNDSVENTRAVFLVYSVIRDRWCRGRLLSYQSNSADGTPINAKVCLIDYGSVEIVLWNAKYVRPSTGEIDAFNDGNGFCFACSLGNIKPAEEEGKPAISGYLQWSSYANFLIDKETRNRTFLLCTENSDSTSQTRQRRNSSPTILTCDLLPLSELELQTQNTHFEEIQAAENFFYSHHQQTNFTSLSAYLVEANVARFVAVNGRANSSSDSDDNEK